MKLKAWYNIVDSLEQINFGIWNAALLLTEELEQRGVKVYVVAPKLTEQFKEVYPSVTFITSANLFKSLEGSLSEYEVDEAVVETHGCWRLPTKLGAHVKQLGYKWIYTPHGMLEPWSMQQKRIKKELYWYLKEKLFAKQADFVRAVSLNEVDNLKQRLSTDIVWVPNGITPLSQELEKSDDVINVVFMARLHHKKGVVPLVEAWSSSLISNDARYKLSIVGPDEGEWEKIQQEVEASSSIEYLGPQYGIEKVKLLTNAHYFILPTFSEGFPTSIVEALNYRIIPIATRGINFDAIFDEGIGVEITTEVASIKQALDSLSYTQSDIDKSIKGKQYVEENLSLESITTKYLSVLGYE